MNLLKDPWLPFRTRGGSIAYRSPSAISDPNIVDLALPRADFQGAAYQFLIGLLQTVYPPQNYGEWVDRSIEPPSGEALDEAFGPFVQTFEFQGDGPRFMQDLDPLEDAKPVSVAGLLIDSPGANGLKLNTDHFVKRGRVEAICKDCVALALFTMQINAPSGGAGYRVGLRGGGPLTTLIVPDLVDANLWQRLWLNVMPIEVFSTKARIRDRCPDDDSLFPWVGATRVSDKKGSEVLPEQMHPMHAYWAMPRRFRLEVSDDEGCCDLCGRKVLQRVSEIRAKNYGANYDGPWQHPLTPYRRDPKKPNELPLSTKGQPGGLGYRYWSNLVLSDAEGSGALPAGVMHDYLSHKVDFVAQERRAGEDIDALLKPRLWVFGYDMDNMKPRGWYSEELPLVAVPAEQQERLRSWVQTFTELSRQIAWMTRMQVKNAWFSRPADAKGDLTSIDSQFYEATQAAFFRALRDMQLALQQGEGPHMPSQVARAWYYALRQEALTLFEAQALSGPFSELDMKRITRARRQLLSWLSGRSKGSKVVSQFAKDGGFTLSEAQGNAPTEEAAP
ncbi:MULTISPECIES: type I-E CRISPR-associated protein Cse1/CasA [unclassified Cobetia]|uniref:type I-E CRISPR-associated protein Cse1/CasA n=1 Tax=unclassified Cobetia TaxID=2609414 RepID=UPI002096A818|nr:MULTISPECIES: type I-E CRISPR-associated protein Cse1/CasA [unclassified Cobetia]MCO7231768.1 type I-E CRISPR-associated protein Cse1/CasA [Cobetia sp. Dlab-2-AX]MCO7234916.1 type I-E CRISPR-associated protein Cse1/CasA [Cobetia sp. Dlab-2-U]